MAEKTESSDGSAKSCRNAIFNCQASWRHYFKGIMISWCKQPPSLSWFAPLKQIYYEHNWSDSEGSKFAEHVTHFFVLFFPHLVIKSVRCVGALKRYQILRWTGTTANFVCVLVTLSFFASKILCNDKLIMLREIWFIKVVGSWPINRSFYRFITFESCYCLGAAVCRLLTFHVSVIALKRPLQTAKSLFLVRNC